MRTLLRTVAAAGLAISAVLSSVVPANAQGKPANQSIKVPVTYYKLGNGLKVVLSPEHSSPSESVPSTQGVKL